MMPDSQKVLSAARFLESLEDVGHPKFLNWNVERTCRSILRIVSDPRGGRYVGDS